MPFSMRPSSVAESPFAEEALVWIVTHVQQDPILERAKVMLIRDHIRSASIGPVFDLSKLFLSRSRITEQLMRAALAKSPHREIQALACFTLARYLEIQAFYVRRDQSIDPAQRERQRATADERGPGLSRRPRQARLGRPR